jgi:hypothetical protein
MLAQERAVTEFRLLERTKRMKRLRALLINGVAASLCRGVPALLPTAARRHPPRRAGSAVATTLRIDGMALGLYLLFAIAIPSLCCADVTKLPVEDRKALQDASRFHEIRATSNLPPAILALCDGGGDGKLAEPGQKWNATDVITDPTLPGKRLIWAAVGGEYYVVHYERGGIHHSFHILVAKLSKDDAKPKVVWRAVGRSFKDYAAFLGALRSGKLDDRLDYPH